MNYYLSTSVTSISLKRIILKTRFDQGLPNARHFSEEESTFDLEEAKALIRDGEVLIRVKAISVDPYLRLDVKTSSLGFGAVPGEVMKGFVVAEVISSKNEEWRIGDIFGSELPFMNYLTINASQLAHLNVWRLNDYVTKSTFTYGAGVLGMPGATAYGGLIDVLQPKAEETIFISAASSAVGGIVGMLAKNLFNCTVIGSCRGKEKCDLITTHYRYDYAIDTTEITQKSDIIQRLVTLAPQGIDMYFENVGGVLFEAVMEVLNPGGRAALCGWISEYNHIPSIPISINPFSMIMKQQRVEGFLPFRWLYSERGNFLSDMHDWIKEGKIKVDETVFQGIENWPIAFQSVFTGEKLGKAVVVL